jgi:protein-glutamine gamma-glutamyltransferase
MSAVLSPPTGRAIERVGALVRPIARREREVRDTLWLLATMAWVMSPHVVDLPVWCSASIAALIVWRGWLTWTGRRLPNRWIPIALTCIAGIAVWLQFRTIFGKDAGVAYVTLLLGLKLLEMRARRDIFVVIYLCLFVMLTSLFESQSMAMAGLLVVGLWMLVTALVSVQFAVHEPPWRTKAAIASRIVLFALPLMAVLFVLFPRVEGPLWGMPSDAYRAKTGLTDVMAPGSFGRLSESRELAFRVRFDDRVPAPAARYWRGPVLGVFDGRAWTPLPARRGANRNIDVDPASAVDYTVTLEPNDRPWLFALDVMGARTEGRIAGTPLAARLRSDLQATSDVPIRERAIYTARSFLRYRAGADEPQTALQPWLDLPPGFDPRTRAFAAAMQRDEDRAAASRARPVSGSERSRHLVDRVIAMIHDERFVYTLDPPPLGRDSVDEFFFDTRSGYCEHYASAFVFLMRALDIPARVVTGYQGGEINPVDHLLEVRQRDAHAWAEVWIAGEGWVRVDPTAAVAPDRIERGAAEAFAATQGFGVGDSWLATLVRNTRFNWDAIGNAWDQWILAYNADRQSGLLSGLGIDRIDWQTLTIALIVAFSAVLAAIGAMTLYRRARVDPVVVQFERACALLARAAADGSRGAARDEAARRPSEGARAYLARIGVRLPEGLRARAEAAFALYEALRYGRRTGGFDENALHARFAASVAALRADRRA